VLDEFQDLAPTALPVLSETMSHSDKRWIVLAGTPKWIDNPLETNYRSSTANEWHVTCGGCGKETLLGEKTLGLRVLQCPSCQHPLDPTLGRWIARNPQSTWGDGYSINHLMVAWMRVADILERQQHYDRVTFLNEVLGQPTTLGDHLITREEIERCCEERPFAQKLEDVPAMFQHQLVMGVDWGGGSRSGTVAVLGYADQQRKFNIVRLDRWQPRDDGMQIMEQLFAICRRFRVRVIAADANGNGSINNRLLFDLLMKDGTPPRMWGIFYGVDTQPPQPHGVMTQWVVGRTPTIGGLFTRIKMQLLRFPRVTESGPFLDEFTCELAEFDEGMRIVKYSKPDDRRDDALHATNYGELVAMRMQSRLQQ